MSKFFIFLILAAAIVGAFTLWGASAGWFNKPTFLRPSLILLTSTTGIIYVYLHRTNKPESFISLYLLTMVIKLAAYCAYLLVIILRDKPAAVSNVGFFMVTYFIFTAIEIAFLHKKINDEKQP